MKVYIKTIFYCFAFLIFVACNEPDFKVGECIQNPDSIIVWKIKSKKDKVYTLYQNQDKREPNLKTTELDGIWTRSNCPNF